MAAATFAGRRRGRASRLGTGVVLAATAAWIAHEWRQGTPVPRVGAPAGRPGAAATAAPVTPAAPIVPAGTARRTARRITTIAVLAPAVALVALAAAAALGPRTGRVQVATVLTGSMRPDIEPGDLVIATPKPVTAVEPGDVLVFEAPLADRRIVTHRVVEVVERGAHPVIRTQGDANPDPDPWDARLEHGPAWEVQATIPFAGQVLEWLRSPLARMLLLWVGPAGLAGLWLLAIWRPAPPEAV